MAESQDFKQVVSEAILDADSLEKFINGSYSETVKTRLNAQYPTLQKAIQDMFKNGALPATPFKTKALMQASSLADGAYSVVTNDSVKDNNGVYVKNGSEWVRANLGFPSNAELSSIITSEINYRLKDNAVETFTYNEFKNDGGYRPNGAIEQSLYLYKHTDAIKITKGDRYTFNYFMTPSQVPIMLIFDNDMKFVKPIYGAGGQTYKSVNGIFDVSGYVIAQHNLNDLGVTEKNYAPLNFKVEKRASIFSSAVNIDNKYVTGYEPVTLTKESVGGQNIPTPYNMRSETIDASNTDYIVLRRKDDVMMGFRQATTAEGSRTGGIRWFGESEIKVQLEKNKNYLTVFASGQAATTNPSLLYNSAYFESKNATMLDVPRKKDILKGIGEVAVHTSYRAYSKVEGGMLSIIDDDGREEVYTELYPFCKANNIPLGVAVSAGNVDATFEGKKMMTTAQVVELSRDMANVEILSHGWTHKGQGAVSVQESLDEIIQAKQWFIANGIHNVSGFVLPYGNDNPEALNRLQQHYNAVYDYASHDLNRVDRITNYLIDRMRLPAYSTGYNELSIFKAKIDEAVATNAWMLITTHIGHPTYWDSNTMAYLKEIVDYAKSKGLRIKLPSEAFQAFGNIVENDSGFKIQADGKIVGAK